MDLLKRYYEEMWNNWNFDLASELLTDDFRFRGSFSVDVVGREAFKDYMRLVQSAFPDFHNKIERSISTPGEVVAQLSYSGTHRESSWALQVRVAELPTRELRFSIEVATNFPLAMSSAIAFY